MLLTKHSLSTSGNVGEYPITGTSSYRQTSLRANDFSTEGSFKLQLLYHSLG